LNILHHHFSWSYFLLFICTLTIFRFIFFSANLIPLHIFPREGARVIWGYVDRILGQPSLVRESSRGRYPWSGSFSRATSTLTSKLKNGSNPGKNGNGFGDVILNPSLQKRVKQLANATANTKLHQAPFRNMLFYGPPGTGKTMAARELARKSVCFIDCTYVKTIENTGIIAIPLML